MLVDLILKNCKIASSSGLIKSGLALDNGKIVVMVRDVKLPASNRIVDCKGGIVLPGGIDFHTHNMDPGYTEREDWRTGTESAAAGGTTLVIDHGDTNPPSTTAWNVRRMKKIAGSKAVVDFGINGAVTSHNLDELSKLRKEGVMAFGEIYMAESIPELETVSDGVLLDAFEIISKLDAIAGVHAENGAIVSYLTNKLKAAGRKDPMAHPDSRPEIESISKALLFAMETGVRLHIFHLTTDGGLRLVKSAKDSGQAVTAETCPHYLLFSTKEFRKQGPYLKCNPPIRSNRNRTALWEGVRQGTIDMISTDHWPLPTSDKEVGWKDIWKAGAGMPGVETRVPLMLTYGVKTGAISLPTFVKVISENPAKVLGLYPQKGKIAVGSDADLIIVNLKEEAKIKTDNLHTKGGFTPYENWKVVGIPWLTLVRGEKVMEKGEIVAKPGQGIFIPWNYSPDSKTNARAGHT